MSRDGRRSGCPARRDRAAGAAGYARCMALFSRRGKGDDPTSASSDAPVGPDDALAAQTAPQTDPAQTAPANEAAPEPVPHVGISVNTFGQAPGTPPPAAAPARPAQTAPAPAEAVAGIVDNVLLQQALQDLPETPTAGAIMNVMRQALQGPLYVRAQGDAQALLAAGEGLNLAITTHEDKRFLLVFSGGAQLQASAREEIAADPSAAISALGQPAHAVLRTAVDSGYDGIYLDHANPGARLVLPVDLVRKALEEGPAVPFELKELIAGPRDESTAARITDVLTRVSVWVAGGQDASGEIGLAEARGQGKRRLEVYSHPVEVIAMGRGDRPLPLTPARLGRVLASEPGLDGVVIDAAGPWIEIDRASLAPVIALAD